MIDNCADALEHALELHARPAALPLLRRRPLPDAVLLLIRIAAGDRQAIQNATARTKVTPRTLTDAAVEYLRQVLFDADADHYRLLGVRSEDGEETFREHYRWLMRWLHPDRDPDHLGESEAQRVNRAWHVLRSSERRLAYDLQRAQYAAWPVLSPVQPSVYRHAQAARPQPQPLFSPQTMRHLPVLVLGGLALLAGGSLAAWHWLDQTGDTNPVAWPGHRSDPRVLAHGPAAPVAQTIASHRVATTVAQITNTAAVIARQDDPSADARMQSTPRATQATSDDSRPPAPTSDASTDAVPTQLPRGDSDTAAPDVEHTAVEHNAEGDSGTDRGYEAVTDAFAVAYAQGDIDRMMDLFAPDAVDDRGGVAVITDEYERLFRSTRSRRMRLGPLIWSPQDDRVIGTGAFDARVRRRGHLYARHLHGRILLEIVPVDDQWKIQRISMQEGRR